MKFKAWDEVNKNMIYYTLLDLINVIDSSNLNKNLRNLVNLTKEDRSPNIMIQYTGKKDMEGTDIYEGDIIYKEIYTSDDPAYNYYGSLGIVEVDEYDNMGWIIVSIDKDNSFYDHGIPNFSFGEIRVTGNIYENPNLIVRTHRSKL